MNINKFFFVIIFAHFYKLNWLKCIHENIVIGTLGKLKPSKIYSNGWFIQFQNNYSLLNFSLSQWYIIWENF